MIRIRRIKDEVKDRLTKSPDAQLQTAGDRLTKSLSAVEEDIYQVKNQSGQDPLNFPIKTNNRLASLLGMTLRGEGKPTANSYPIFEDLKKELRNETDRPRRSPGGRSRGVQHRGEARRGTAGRGVVGRAISNA